MAKNKAASKAAPIETEDALLDAYAPTALLLQGRDHVIRACDGDQEYVYLATFGRNLFTVTEVYPGLDKPRTHVRDAETLQELIVGKFKTVELAMEKLKAMIFEGFEFIPEERSAIVLVRSAVSRQEPKVTSRQLPANA